MALLMDPGADPVTDNERADLEAIAAIKESTAVELKEQGNQFVKKGKKHYKDAIDCYTRAINQKALNDSETSVLFSNRAHVNLMLENYRWALNDAEEAIKLSPSNVKAYYRAAKAAFALELSPEAASYCQRGLEKFPSNEELKKLLIQIDERKKKNENHKAQVSKAIAEAKELASAIENRGLKLGKAMYQELTGVRKPLLDKSGILHWPVLLLYAEIMSSDFIEDFCETDMFSAHLDMAHSGFLLSKKKILHHLLEGTVATLAEDLCDEEKDAGRQTLSKGSDKWIKVNEKKTLHDILRQPDYIIPGIPVFFVVSSKSRFYKEFKAGKWTPP